MAYLGELKNDVANAFAHQARKMLISHECRQFNPAGTEMCKMMKPPVMPMHNGMIEKKKIKAALGQLCHIDLYCHFHGRKVEMPPD